MENKSIGFIGGGRITRILLERMSNAGKLNSAVVVSDVNESVRLWANSKYSFEEIYDLVPVKPLADSETLIKDIYRTKLEEIYSKLTN